jgi:hypothetical protein
MRATIEPHNQAAITALMEQFGTTNPSVAVNFIIHLYRTGQQATPIGNTAKPAAADGFDDVADWG